MSAPDPKAQQTSALLRRIAIELFAVAQNAGHPLVVTHPKELNELAIELQVRAARIEVERQSAEKTVAALDATKVEKVLAHARLDTVKYIDDAPKDKTADGTPTPRSE